MGRIGSMLIAVVLAATVVLSGCKPSQQSPAGDKGKTDANKPVEKPKDTGPKVEQPANPIDAKDSADPRVQGRFPKSGVVGQWTKVVPVSLYEPGANFDAIKDMAGYPPYGVDWVCEMMYQLGGDQNQRAVVRLFHCANARNAFGLMTTMSASPLGARFGPFTDARGDGSSININKGQFLLSVYAAGPQDRPGFVNALSDLAQWIVDHIQPEPTGLLRPDLVEAMPIGLGEPAVQYFRGGYWLARSNPALAADNAARLQTTDELLLANYSFRPSADASPRNIQMFVIRYGSPGEATEAHERLDRLQKEAASAIGTDLLVGGVKGRHVYGAITGGNYGLMEDWVNHNHADEAMKYPVMQTLEAVLGQ